ncbi:UNVERIFIED_CONTAM: putative inactive heme oxygenase 2, chloroplastic, partial [Sesamum radiatum]
HEVLIFSYYGHSSVLRFYVVIPDVYFRKTGLERSDCISRDLKWLSEQGNVIPEPSNPGITYVQYLEELAEKTPPLFLCHFYNIFLTHCGWAVTYLEFETVWTTEDEIVGYGKQSPLDLYSRIIAQVSRKLLEGRELEFYQWEGDAEELLRGVREKLNALGEHWSRDEKNKCLREATKAFRFLGQIVRLIIL